MRCPVCARELAIDACALARGGPRPPYFPFCGERCKLVDFGRWATGRYAIPGEPVDDAAANDLEADGEGDAPLR